MEHNKFLSIFSNCFLVKGVQRGLIFDTQRKKYHLVPIGFIDFLNNAAGEKLALSLAQFDNEDREIVEEYLEYATAEEIIFYCDSKEELSRFPATDTTWDYPATFTNAVVIVTGKDSLLRFNRFKKSCFIPYITYILSAGVADIDELYEYTDLMISGNIKGVQIILNNRNNFSKETMIEFCNMRQVEAITLYNSAVELSIKSFSTAIYFNTRPDAAFGNCGLVGPDHFNLQMEHYTEALQHNTCLNRKLSIDENGNIKNCIAMSDTYGHIDTTNIYDLLEDYAFRKLWTLHKDNISKCRDCEFRYACTDCRAYLDNPGDIHSAPLKCGYDPYTCTWSDWSTNPLKTKAISFYQSHATIPHKIKF